MALPGRKFIKDLIKDHGGVISEMARNCKQGIIGKKGVSRQTIYNWIEHYDLRDECEKARVSMRMVSRDVIYQRLLTGDDDAAFEAAKFVTLHLNDSGELLYVSPETLRMLRELGVPLSSIADEIERGVQRMHSDSKDEDNDE